MNDEISREQHKKEIIEIANQMLKYEKRLIKDPIVPIKKNHITQKIIDTLSQ
jgi:hypothetical protein